MPEALALSTIWALLWLLYRAWQVFQTPIPDLIEKLALDIPPPPELMLECIQSTEVRISWKQPDSQNSTAKYAVYVNDAKIGETKRIETGVTIFNLEPNTRYTIRVFAASNSNHHTPSPFIGVRTLPQNDAPEHVPINSFPRLRTFVPAQASLPTISAPSMAREPSGGPPHGRRIASGRKHSPSNARDNVIQSLSDDVTGDRDRMLPGESLDQLAEQLKALQAETDELDKQHAEEEIAHQAQMEVTTKDRDRLRKEWKEREEASSELKKYVANLDRENRNIQNKKHAKEKILKQKKCEREKYQQDIERWKKEIEEMRNERSRLQSETVENEKRTAEKSQELQDQISGLQAEAKEIDEENRKKAAELKSLEEERNSLLSNADSEEAQEFERLEREREQEWENKFIGLQQRSHHLIHNYHQAQQQCQEAEKHLSLLTARRSSASGTIPSMSQLEMVPSRKNSMRRNRGHRSSLIGDAPSPSRSFMHSDTGIPATAGFVGPSNMSPTFSAGAPLFSFNAIPTDGSGPTQVDVDNLSGGAPMSPRADSLLPSDLLGDEEPPPTSPASNRPTAGPAMSSFGVPLDSQLTNSPISSNSRPGSIFSSPRESTHNLAEADRRSINSGNLSLSQLKPTTSATSRLSSFFTTRPKGKTVGDDGPLLGSLKPGQSQSFPRNLEELDPMGSRRRRGSHSGSSWTNSLWTRGIGTGGSSSGPSAQMPSALKRFPALFQPRSGSLTSLKSDMISAPYNQFGPIDSSSFLRRESASPRPLSTYSAEHPLPRPTESQTRFGWPPFSSNGQRNSPLGPDWSSPPPWSRSQSRRPSFQYGSTSNLSISVPPDADIIENHEERKKPLDPIGTRPASSKRPATPKLNPNAPSFKFFGGGKKNAEKEKAKKKDTPEKSTPEITAEDASPQDAGLSRDSHSITTAESNNDSLERIPSGAPSDGTPIQKETLMQKITRKSSSSKFNMPWKDKLSSSKKGESPSTPGEIDEDETSGVDPPLGKSVESVEKEAVGDIGKEKDPSKGGDKEGKDKGGDKEKEKEKAPRTSLSFRSFTMRKPRREKDKADTSAASESSEKASETGDDDTAEEE